MNRHTVTLNEFDLIQYSVSLQEAIFSKFVDCSARLIAVISEDIANRIDYDILCELIGVGFKTTFEEFVAHKKPYLKLNKFKI